MRLRTLLKLPNLLVVLAPFLLMAPLVLARRALFWGTPALQFVPWWWWSWEALNSGHLPLWNPLAGMGAPLLANYQSALFYPPNWLYFLLAALGGLPALAWGQALLVALHLAIAGLGMVAVSRSLALGPLAQAIAGLSFGLSAYLVGRAGFLSILSAAAWLPWIMFAVRQLALDDRPRRWLLTLAGLWGLQLLAGHAQTAWYTILLAMIWAAYWAGGEIAVSRRSIWLRLLELSRPVVKTWSFLGAALLTGTGLAAVQLIPTAEYLLHSQRAAAVDLESALTYSFWPWRILGLLAPDLFGSPLHGDYWGYAAYWEDAVYIGLLPALLAVGQLLRLPRRTPQDVGPPARNQRRFALLLAGIAALSFLLALGKNTPIFPWLYRFVPTFNMFQAPTRFMIWAVFAFALLAALGAERLQKPEGRTLYWTRLATAGAVAVGLGAGLTWLFLGDVRPTFIRATALAGVLGVGAGALLLLMPDSSQGQQTAWWRWAVAGFVGVDLLYAGWGLNPSVSLDFYRLPGPTAAEVATMLDGGRLFLGADLEYDLKFSRFLTFRSFTVDEDWSELRAALLPNIHMLDRISHTSNFDPLVPERYAVWIDTLQRASGADRNRMLNLSGVTVVESADKASDHGIRFEALPGPDALRWVPCAAWSEGPEGALEFLLEDQFDPAQFVAVELRPGQTLVPADCEWTGDAHLASSRPSPNHLMLQVTSSSEGWVFIPEVWYPGWQAYLDGIPTHVWRANYLFRAIPVPAGEHTLDMHYRPLSFYLGAFFSLATILAIAGYLVRRK